MRMIKSLFGSHCYKSVKMISVRNFSVLMSVYSRETAEFFDVSLHSILLEQTLLPSEIVLVADGPLTDELYHVVDKYRLLFSNFKFIELPENVGLGNALNEGLKYCSNEWVARMDSDDVSMPNRFEVQIQYIQNHPNVDVVGAWVSEFEHDVVNVLSIKKVPVDYESIISYSRTRNPINHPVVMFRKSAVLSAGGYEHCPYFEDYWLWVRMLRKKSVFYNIPISLLWFRTSCAMYQRRGGFMYVCNELHFQKLMSQIGFITRVQFVKNIIIRIGFRLIPNSVRAKLYKIVLRSND